MLHWGSFLGVGTFLLSLGTLNQGVLVHLEVDVMGTAPLCTTTSAFHHLLYLAVGDWKGWTMGYKAYIINKSETFFSVLPVWDV